MNPEELIGKYLRDRKPSSEEERLALDHVWMDLRSEGDGVTKDLLRELWSDRPARPMSRRPVETVVVDHVEKPSEN